MYNQCTTYTNSIFSYVTGTVAKLLKYLRAVDDLNLSIAEQVKIAVIKKMAKDHDGTEHHATSLHSIVAKVETEVTRVIQDKYHYLQHPGNVIYLRKLASAQHTVNNNVERARVSEDQFVAVRGDSLETPNILYLLRNMVMDHRRPAYRTALSSL